MMSLLFLPNDTLNIECHADGSIYTEVQFQFIHSIYHDLNTSNSVTILQFDNLLLNEISFDMPSTRKQEAKEKRSRQSEVLSDIENLDVML